MVASTPKEADKKTTTPHRYTPPPEPQRVAASPYGMVAAQHQDATQAGVEILEEGGNAIDAAVAAAFALGVCEPAASGLGGQTMVIVYLAESGRTFALDGSSRAPNRATIDVMEPRERLRGHKATTVPTTPAVLGYMLKRYGTLPLPRILEPAVRLAENGYAMTALQRALTKRELRHLKARSAGPFFLNNGEKAYSVGATFRQPVLAQTLKRLATKGIREFYTGRISRQIHEDMTRNGGLIRKDDLAQIPLPIERRPLSCRFDGLRVFTFPPPGAGRTLVEMLQILQELPTELRNLDTPEGAVALSRVIRRANRDRQDRPFDPNYYAQSEKKRMMSAPYAKLIAQRVQNLARSSGETTHLSVMDRHGNVVGLTQSIERVYGSCALHPDLGFLYNNYMSAFEYENMSHPYYLRPNASPWGSVAPTIAFRGRRPRLVIGSPGSERITSTIAQVLLRLDHQSPLDAVAAARLHCSLEGKVSLEASRLRDDIPKRLVERGFDLDIREPFAFYLGCVQMVIRNKKEFLGVADPRRDGSAKGPSK